MKVLIVDDEDLIRNIIKDYCINEGYSTYEASDGIEAIDVFKKNADIDIIVLDIMMPNMDGYTAYREIKKFEMFQLLFYQRVEKCMIS